MHVLGKRVPQDARKYCDLIQELGADAGCQFLKLGPSSTILRHQAEEGFAHVEEQTLEEIHDKILKIPKPVADDGACRKDELALSLMKKLHPTWAATEAMKALSRAFILENPDSTLDPKIIPKQCLMELVTPNEASTIDEAFERAKKLKKHEGCRYKQRKASVEKFFKPFPKKTSAKKKAPRWKATKNPDVPAATEWLLANIPSSISLEEDGHQGRWRILCDSGSCKSVAWSRRGLQHACELVLYHSWNMHTPHTGEECPFDNIEDLHWA